jgi:ribosomal protein S18 acetylase RimI-like enzyme
MLKTLAPIIFLRHQEPMVAQAITALQRRSYRAEAELIGFPDLPPLKESPGELMQSREHFSGIRVRSGLVALIAVESSTAELVISRLCVAPDHTRRGLATRLVRHVMTDTDTRVVVETATANLPALSLYRKLGFTEAHRFRSKEGLELVRAVARP